MDRNTQVKVCLYEWSRGDLLSWKVLSEQDANQTEYLNLMFFQKMVCYSFISFPPPISPFSLYPTILMRFSFAHKLTQSAAEIQGRETERKGDLGFQPVRPGPEQAGPCCCGAQLVSSCSVRSLGNVSCYGTSLQPAALFSREEMEIHHRGKGGVS